MSKKNPENKKMPELIVDGEKVKFHYDREERLARSYKCIKSDNSFFNKRNRYIHIIILDIIFIVIIGLIFYSTVGKAKGHIEDGFKFYFSKKIIDDSPILDIRMSVKNISKVDSTLSEDFREMELNIFNEGEKIIYNKTFLIKKRQYKPDEFYTEYLLIDKPQPGKYRATIYFSLDKTKSLTLNFLIK